MNELFEIDERDTFERQIIFLPLDSLESLPSDLRLPSPHFVLFLACDANQITLEAIYDFARRTVELGAAYVCAWGEGCERTHDIFDEFLVEREIEESKEFPLVMTTWHSSESLDEALWFALNVAYPDDEFAESCGSTLVVSVANEKWNAHFQERLANLQQFNEELVSAD